MEILITIFAEYGREGIEPDIRDVVSLSPGQYEAVAGQYRIDELEDPVIVSVEDGALVVTMPTGGEPRKLLAESPTEFFLKDDGMRVGFVIDHGTASEIVVAGALRGRRPTVNSVVQ